jgi:hypothetical protein
VNGKIAWVDRLVYGVLPALGLAALIYIGVRAVAELLP